jgi:hypothetical protein
MDGHSSTPVLSCIPVNAIGGAMKASARATVSSEISADVAINSLRDGPETSKKPVEDVNSLCNLLHVY